MLLETESCYISGGVEFGEVEVRKGEEWRIGKRLRREERKFLCLKKEFACVFLSGFFFEMGSMKGRHESQATGSSFTLHLIILIPVKRS